MEFGAINAVYMALQPYFENEMKPVHIWMPQETMDAVIQEMRNTDPEIACITGTGVIHLYGVPTSVGNVSQIEVMCMPTLTGTAPVNLTVSGSVSESRIISNRESDWLDFSDMVAEHIDTYTVPQYGDKPDDIVSTWTAQECINSAQKYLARFGKNQRPGQEKLDLMKCAHMVQIAFEKMNQLHSTSEEQV